MVHFKVIEVLLRIDNGKVILRLPVIIEDFDVREICCNSFEKSKMDSFNWAFGAKKKPDHVFFLRFDS